MRISYASDIHLEFGTYDITNDTCSDVLVLAGDICVGKSLGGYVQDFFEKCSNEFVDVIYIMGNHEYYGYGDINDTFYEIKNKLNRFKNIHVLNNETLDIGNHRFICSTLWTDLNKNDIITESVVRNLMNDYKVIRNGKLKLQPCDTYKLHKSSLWFINGSIENGKTNIVVSHHAPSDGSINENFKYDYHPNGAYRTILDEFIMDRDIKLWIHGHTHNPIDYMIGNCRVVSNQRGYIGHEKLADSFKLQYVDI